jgi:hypothetical protein
MMSQAKSFLGWLLASLILPASSWILGRGRLRGLAALRHAAGILGKVFRAEGKDPYPTSPEMSRISRTYLKHLGRLARREMAQAGDLGSLAKVFHSAGLRGPARRAAAGAWMHWQKARRAHERLSRRAEKALGEYAL